jgi:hypothetical protein
LQVASCRSKVEDSKLQIADWPPATDHCLFRTVPHAPLFVASAFASGYGGQVGAPNDAQIIGHLATADWPLATGNCFFEAG